MRSTTTRLLLGIAVLALAFLAFDLVAHRRWLDLTLVLIALPLLVLSQIAQIRDQRSVLPKSD